MVDGFGTRIAFAINDSADVDNFIALINAERDGADNSGRLTFYTYNAGSASEAMRITSDQKLGVGTTSVYSDVQSQFKTSVGVLAGKFERESAVTSASSAVLGIQATSTGDMVDGFGPTILFRIRDSASVNNNIGYIEVLRDGADNSGAFTFYTYNAGSASEAIRIKANQRVGIGETDPDNKLHVTDSSIPGLFERTNTSTTGFVNCFYALGTTTNDMVDGYGSSIGFQVTDSGAGPNTLGFIGFQRDGADDSGKFVIRPATTGSFNDRVTVFNSGGVNVGAPTGGDKGAGTINVSGDIYKNNSAYTNPDYVFEHYFTNTIERFKENEGAKEYKGRLDIYALRDYVRTNFHFPQLAEKEKGAGIFERGDKLLEIIEEQATYIFEMKEEIDFLRAALNL